MRRKNYSTNNSSNIKLNDLKRILWIFLNIIYSGKNVNYILKIGLKYYKYILC